MESKDMEKSIKIIEGDKNSALVERLQEIIKKDWENEKDKDSKSKAKI